MSGFLSKNTMNKKDIFKKMFLDFEDGQEPLLNGADEINIAATVHKYATKHFEDKKDDDTDSVLSFEEKVVTTRCDLKTVSDLFAKTNKAKKLFQKNLPAFKECRLSSVSKLMAIADSIHKDRFNGNISKIVGGCTGAAGATVLITALAAHLAAPVVLPMTVAGGVASALGGGTVFGTTCVEMGLVKSKMKGATLVISEDRAGFESMEHWFGHAECLMEVINKVVGFGVMKKILEDVKKFLDDVNELKNKNKMEYNTKFRNLVDTSVKQMSADGAIQAKFGVDFAPVVITFVFVVCLLSPRNRFVFECLVITHRLGLGLLGVLDVGVQIGRLVAGLVLRGGAAAAKVLPQAAARAWALCAFAAAGLVIDVANVVVAAVDLHSGSRSEQADAVRAVARELEKELRFLEEVDKEITASTPQVPKKA